MTVADIGKRIKSRRKEISLSAEKLAEMVGVSAATVYRWENGDIETIKISKVADIAKALFVTEAYLAGWADFPTPQLSDEDLLLLSLYHQAPENIKEAVNRILEPYRQTPQEQRAI